MGKDDVSSNLSVDDEFNDVIKGLIKLLMMVVFLGIIMIWIMMPTQTYRTIWRPKMRAKFGNSTYFGAQGVTLLMYMFPMIFIATLGCVYLHLKKQKSANQCKRKMEKKKYKMETWRKPMMVKGPLGIVSGIELGFLVMFLGLLVWSFSIYLHDSFATLSQSAVRHGEKVWEAKLESAGLRLGLIGNIILAFVFLPVARGSSLLPLVGLTSESSIKYHIWLGHLVLTFFTAHGLCYILYWASTHHISQMTKWAKTDISNVAGEIALVAGLGMWATTFPAIRRKKFEVFFYSHYLYIFFVVFFVLHVGISFSFMALPGIYIFLVDRFLRFLQSRDNVRLISARILPCNAVELNFAKNPRLTYSPTSTMFVNIPSISKLQWHPFTITSSSNLEPETLSVVIKSEGSWSSKLHRVLSSSDANSVCVSVEGPYGPVSTDFLRYDSLVMVSGGSGITPFISIIRDLISTTRTPNYAVPKITLICAFKNYSDLSMLDLILPISGTPTEISSALNLQIEAFITREDKPENTNGSTEKMTIRTLYFKPSLLDKPISAILGPNSWLYLGAILSSSFVIFLLLIGIITRFHIYPIDHNTNEVYSFSAKSVLYILTICVSVMGAASAAVLWNKKKYGVEGSTQVQNVNLSTPPTASPSSWVYNSDREIESSPQQSLAQSTSLHFGQRPDLKKLLFEAKGSRVGVLVCGPKKMRHEVAMICSSGLAHNLHFESISFSW